MNFVQYPADNCSNIHIFTSTFQIVRIDNLAVRRKWFLARKWKLVRLWCCLMTHYWVRNSSSLQLWEGFKPPEFLPWLHRWSRHNFTKEKIFSGDFSEFFGVLLTNFHFVSIIIFRTNWTLNISERSIQKSSEEQWSDKNHKHEVLPKV